MGKPHNWRWNPLTQQWEIQGRGDGNPLLAVSEAGMWMGAATATLPNVNVGTLLTAAGIKVANETFTFMRKITGTMPAITAVGTATVAVATITGVASGAIAVGDIVTGVPKVAMAGKLGLAGFHIPTTNVVNAYVINPAVDSAGSLTARGIDLFITRGA